MRNSNTMAIAPTATIANISGVVPGIEPIYKNIYVKANISGDFVIVNSFLVADLKARNLWNQEILNTIKYNDGSIQDMPQITTDLKDKYRETFEIDMRWLIRAAAARGKWIDQSQSLNIFFSGTSGEELSDLYLYAWESGLKTTYYLRSLAASQVEKSTVSEEGSHLRTKGDGNAGSSQHMVQDGAIRSPMPTPSPMTQEAVEAGMVAVLASSYERSMPENTFEVQAEFEVVEKPHYTLHIAEDAICEVCQ